jgi:N-acetylglucosamine malate deacetylase 1
MRLSHRNFVPAVANVPLASNVLVLAPHMDDETIGCGGAILSHVAQGSRVEVLFVTDGAEGFDKSVQADSAPSQRGSIRRGEGGKACALLGVSKSHYLDLPDGHSQVTTEAVSKLVAVMEELQPDVIYLPFFTDTHHDHRVTNQLLREANRQSGGNSHMLCCCYEVWTPIYANCIVDISAYMDTKMAALECYESQLQMNNYLSSVKGLNAYRSIANRSKGYAEAFYLTTVRDYISLFNDA